MPISEQGEFLEESQRETEEERYGADFADQNKSSDLL